MAYSIVSLDSYKQHKDIIDALTEFENPFDFGEGVSLANYKAANDAVKAQIKSRNDALKTFLEQDEKLQNCINDVDKKNAQIKHCIKGIKGENSDEYVAAGGKRRSDITAQALQTRVDNKKKNPPKE